MNALGLAYGSSDDDDASGDEQVQQQRLAPAAASTSAPTPAAVAAVIPAAATDTVLNEDYELEAMLALAGIPPEPVGVCANPDVQARIRTYIATQEQQHGGVSTASGESSFQANLRAKKDVRNPYILEKVVAHFGIDELQTNFDTRVFDPHALPLHEFSDALALAQKKRSDAREQHQLQMQSSGDPRLLQFTHGTS